MKTPDGDLYLGRDGWSTIYRIARLSWQRSLFNSEPRMDPDTADALVAGLPTLGEHVVWCSSFSALHARVAAGSGHCASMLSHVRKEPIPCLCGSVAANREHLVWDCEATSDLRVPPLPEDSTPFCRALLLRVSPPCIPRPICDPLESLEEVVAARALIPAAEEFVVATDGSGLGEFADLRCAGSGVASVLGSMGFRYRGADQTVLMAEIWAVAVACAALAGLVRRVSCVLLVDNKETVRALEAILHGVAPATSQSGERSALWDWMRRSCHQCAGRLRVAWVPAHGRHADWTAPFGLDSVECRRLNQEADRAAGQAAHRVFSRFSAERQELESSLRASRIVLRAAHAAIERFGAYALTHGWATGLPAGAAVRPGRVALGQAGPRDGVRRA